jgi:hypothetical protein
VQHAQAHAKYRDNPARTLRSYLFDLGIVKSVDTAVSATYYEVHATMDSTEFIKALSMSCAGAC